MDADKKEPLSNVSDESFILLGHGSFNTTCSGEFLKSEDDGCNTTSDPKTDISVQEIVASKSLEIYAQSKLHEILRENYQLKETLSQNNLAIKSQLNTFFMWQQEVLKTHEAHKQKFLETKDLILKLKAENANLKEQVQNSMVTTNMESNNYIDEIEKLKQEISKSENMYSDLEKINNELQAENQELKENVKKSEEEIIEINKLLEVVKEENVKLKLQNSYCGKSQADSFGTFSLPNSEARVQINNLLKQLEEEKVKVKKLENELNKTNQTGDEAKSSSDDLTKCIHQLDDIDLSYKTLTDRIHNFNSWLWVAQDNLTKKEEVLCSDANSQLMLEVNQLQNDLQQKKSEVKEKEETIQLLQEQINHLLEDYKDLHGKMQSLEINNTNIENYRSEITNLTEKLQEKDYDEKLKDEECNRLKETIKKLNSECEEIAVLKIQLQLNESDFKEERNARERLANEKEDLAEQVRILQNKIEELEKGLKNDDRNEPSSLAKKQKKFLCPQCLLPFLDLKSCVEHFDECNNIHFYS